MTVKELRAQLEKFPDHFQVAITYDDQYVKAELRSVHIGAPREVLLDEDEETE